MNNFISDRVKQTLMNVYQQSSADILPNHTISLANTLSSSVAKQSTFKPGDGVPKIALKDMK